MPALQQHTVWTAYLLRANGPLSRGACLVLDEIDEHGREVYALATAERRAATGRTRAVAGITISTTADAGELFYSVEVQVVGPAPREVTGLPPSAAGMLRVGDAGRLERIVTPDPSDVIAGSCDADGFAYLNFASSGSAGPQGPKGDDGEQGPKGDTGDPGLPVDLVAGDLLYFDGAVLARIPTEGVPDGYVLTASGGVPVWAEPPAGPPPGDAPVLVAHDRDLADSAGGDVITSTVEHLEDGATVTVGGASATVVSIDVDEDEIVWTMPARSAGMHDVVVTTSDGPSNALAIEVWSAGATGLVLLADLNPRHAVVDAGVVQVLPDMSGNGFDAVAPEDSEPTYAASVAGYANKPAVYFPTAAELGGDTMPAKVLDMEEDIGAAVDGDRVTIFIVGHVVATPGNKYFIITRSGFTVGAYVDGNPIWNAYANGTDGDYISNEFAQTPNVVGIAFDDNDRARMYLGAKTPFVTTNVMIGKVSAGARFRLGCWQTAQAQWSASGYQARILVYKGSLDQGQCESVMTALGRLYGLAVGS
ncbi:MAG: IPT/TIG domain-containing protein [Labilithrix sp.]|nr:IPT/TIG domain-containing protein [Labilithrix sp.]